MTRTLTTERILAASPERVWRAWTTTDGLARWWWIHLPGTSYQLDLRVGGSYHINSPTAGIGVHGEYLRLAAPRSFSATWIWVDDGVDGALEQISVSFTEHPCGTRLTVAHEGEWTSEEPAATYQQGWNDVLDALEKALAH